MRKGTQQQPTLTVEERITKLAEQMDYVLSYDLTQLAKRYKVSKHTTGVGHLSIPARIMEEQQLHGKYFDTPRFVDPKNKALTGPRCPNCHTDIDETEIFLQRFEPVIGPTPGPFLVYKLQAPAAGGAS